jgi:4-alpha-glucanotransferase
MPNNKNCGILVHITSLPNEFGIGDLGSCSKRFIDLLKSHNQSYWQILPINYPDYSASPYSCLSAFAGNPFLLSLESLLDKKLLDEKDVFEAKEHFTNRTEMDFSLVKKVKLPLLQKAFQAFLKNDSDQTSTQFSIFQKDEEYWLHNFSLFKTIGNTHGEKWWQWPEFFKESENILNSETTEIAQQLKLSVEDLETEILFQKWLQFEFDNQWSELKEYAHHNNIQIIGDIPIFVSHRSQDVWAWKNGFQVKIDGTLKLEAGVPPDQFSDDGQKWSMPTYNWEAHSQSQFDWWRKRISKQFEFYDLVRLDHFIGFHHLFNIPPADRTAANGTWLPTPGQEMLNLFHTDYSKGKESLKSSPFIAEDLGEITPEVDKLRDEFNIPSMKVIQFGFWSDKANDHHPESIQPNSIYYTGTHDTSTLKGWLNQADKSELERIKNHFKTPLEELNQFHFINSLLNSPAEIKIIPIQDLFFLSEEHRFNRPGTEGENWIWRINEDLLYNQLTHWETLKNYCEVAGA